MPEPSTTEGRRVHGELRDLLETAAVQQAESSASRRRGGTSEQPTARPRQGQDASVRPEAARAPTVDRAPSVRDRLRDQHEAQGNHEVVAGDGATTTGPPEATTHTEAVATTVGKTAVLPLSRLVLESLVEPSALLIFRPDFSNRPTSQSTVAKPILNFGWPITAWLVS